MQLRKLFSKRVLVATIVTAFVISVAAPAHSQNNRSSKNTLSLYFGDQIVGTSSAPQDIQITNTTRRQITIWRFSVSSEAFSYSGPSLPVTLNPGETMSGSVTFAPTDLGPYIASLNFWINRWSSSTFWLEGNGIGDPNAAPEPTDIAPSIMSQPTSQEVTAGETGTFTVSASGTTPMSYQWRKNGANISGATSSTYTTSPTTSSDDGALFSVVVSNSAGSATSNNATLTVNDVGQLTLNPSSLSFGSVDIGDTSTLSSTLTNSGGSPVTISNISLSGPGFSLSGLSTGTILSPGQNDGFTVSFSPSSTSSVTGSVTITSDASPVTLSLSGTGVAVVSNSVMLSWSPVSSATGYNVYRGTTSGGPYTKLTASPSALSSYDDSSVQSGQTYYYVVTSLADNLESAYSNQASASIP